MKLKASPQTRSVPLIRRGVISLKHISLAGVGICNEIFGVNFSFFRISCISVQLSSQTLKLSLLWCLPPKKTYSMHTTTAVLRVLNPLWTVDLRCSVVLLILDLTSALIRLTSVFFWFWRLSSVVVSSHLSIHGDYSTFTCLLWCTSRIHFRTSSVDFGI